MGDRGGQLLAGKNGFIVEPDLVPQNGYDMHTLITNAGTADLVDQFEISFNYYVGANGSGTLEPNSCCATEGGPVIAAGRTYDTSLAGYHLDPGDYIIYAYLDLANLIDESNEEDNEARFDLHVP